MRGKQDLCDVFVLSLALVTAVTARLKSPSLEIRMEALFASIAAEVATPVFWSALLAIIMIDLVLGGDNAIVIGLAARNVPKEMQAKVVMWGTAGAIIIRVLMTSVVVYLLKIPGFMVMGGVVLVWIAYKLVAQADAEHNEDNPNIVAKTSIRGAIQTIVIADLAMSIDNVLAVGGAARGSILLVILGLAISIPIIVGGSRIVLKLVERFPIIIELGAAVLAWTAAAMISNEPLLRAYIDANPVVKVTLYVVTFIVVLWPWIKRMLRHKKPALNDAVVVHASAAERASSNTPK